MVIQIFYLSHPDINFFKVKFVSMYPRVYNAYYDGEDMSMLSKDVTTGLIVYFAKKNDVKEWVINDIGVSL